MLQCGDHAQIFIGYLKYAAALVILDLITSHNHTNVVVHAPDYLPGKSFYWYEERVTKLLVSVTWASHQPRSTIT